MTFARYILLILFLVLLLPQAKAKKENDTTEINRDVTEEVPTTIYVLPNTFPAVIIDGERVAVIQLPEFVKFAPLQFRNVQEQVAFHRLVRDVRRTLPYAKRIAQIMIETYQFLETLPDDAARQRHLNQMDRHLRQEYTPRMRQLTRSQGQLLMLLVDRETNSSSFQIIEATMGRMQAVAANAFARLFGNNLRTRYDPHGEHQLIERICVMIELGLL